MHLWSSRVATGTTMAGLLLLAAADQARDVIIAEIGLEWLYHRVHVDEVLGIERRDDLARDLRRGRAAVEVEQLRTRTTVPM